MKHKIRQLFSVKFVKFTAKSLLVLSLVSLVYLLDKNSEQDLPTLALNETEEINNKNESEKISERSSMKIMINKTDITHLTRQEIEEVLKNEYDLQKKRTIKAIYVDKEFEISREELSMTFEKDIQSLLDDIENFKTEMLLLEMIHQVQIPLVESFKINYDYDEKKLETWIQSVRSAIEVSYMEPKIIKTEEDEFEQISGIPGVEIRIDKFRHDIEMALSNDSKSTADIIILTETILPKRDHLLLEQVDTKIASFSSIYPTRSLGRAENVRIAANRVDQTILMPGDEFSFTEKVSPITEAAGYRNATTFLNGQPIDGIGGGVCQVSSTLYNAQLQAGIIAVQRQNHSRYVDYVPRGQDATIASGLIDYRFKNTLDYPIYIAATTHEGSLTIEFWSSSKALNGITYSPRTIYFGLTEDGKRMYDTTLYGYNSKGEVIFEKYLHRSIYRTSETP